MRVVVACIHNQFYCDAKEQVVCVWVGWVFGREYAACLLGYAVRICL